MDLYVFNVSITIRFLFHAPVSQVRTSRALPSSFSVLWHHPVSHWVLWEPPCFLALRNTQSSAQLLRPALQHGRRHRKCLAEWLWLCYNKTLFTRRGLALGMAHLSCSKQVLIGIFIILLWIYVLLPWERDATMKSQCIQTAPNHITSFPAVHVVISNSRIAGCYEKNTTFREGLGLRPYKVNL